MLKMSRKTIASIRSLQLAMLLLVAFATIGVAQERQYSPQAWSFGVVADTQWTPGYSDPAGTNPDFIAASVLQQIETRFIQHKVEFAFHMGDTSDFPTATDTLTLAQQVQPLYDKKIGYFPMRGNHAAYYGFYYTQPTDDPDPLQLNLFRSTFPQTRGKANTFGTYRFSSPTEVSTDLDGLSYSFDYGHRGNSARFVVLDNMATPSKTTIAPSYVYYGYPLGEQQTWIDGRLKNKPTTHAFVLTHQPLMGQNHADAPFGGWVYENFDQQNAFLSSLQENGVRYYLSAHDHIHQRSVITSPDARSSVEQLIAAPACPKFYLASAADAAKWGGQKSRELSLSQEASNVGYYIYTVDGPRVNVDYYSDKDGGLKSDANWPRGAGLEAYPLLITPTFNFVKKESWGYSLNGQEFLVPRGAPYTDVKDKFHWTAARIVGGFNNSTAADGSARQLTKKVTTGWTAKDKHDDNLRSDILSLWGMADLGATQTDTYALSMTFDLRFYDYLWLKNIGIATVDAKGCWVNAVQKNNGGAAKFVIGPYKAEYELGTYGIDPLTRSAWAVVNYNADFAVAQGVAVKQRCGH